MDVFVIDRRMRIPGRGDFGKRFDQYLQETIFDPLDMKDTSFTVAARKPDRFAANYERQPDKTLKLIDDPERSTYLKQPTFFSGGGGLTGTTADYSASAKCCDAAANSTACASSAPAPWS